MIHIHIAFESTAKKENGKVIFTNGNGIEVSFPEKSEIGQLIISQEGQFSFEMNGPQQEPKKFLGPRPGILSY